MKVDLLEHNQKAYEKVMEAIADGKKKLAISHATGTGKSYLTAKLFEDYGNDKKLVLVPSIYISEQIKKLFEKYSIQNVDIMLYQKLIKMNDEEIAVMDYGVIALDEYHHDTSKVWGEKVKQLIDSHPESIIFGTSATPVRSDNVNTIDELFEGNCVSDLSLSESIANKIVPLPKYVGALYTLDDELEKLRKKIESATNTKEEKQKFYKKINAMRSQIEKSYGMPIILNKHIKNREGKYIIFCKKKKHLREIKDTVIGWFKTAGFKDINAYEVYSDYESKDVEYKAFCNDTSHNLKLLFCVNMLNEGLHLENISGVLLLRPTRSSIVWHQQIGRAIEANNTNIPVIIDAVNNFSSVGQGMKLLKEIKDAVAKEKESDPDFDDSGFEDIDTFFVVEQAVEIQEMFKEIEERLQGSWDLHIKALKQYKEREGDCLVPHKHIEIIDGKKVSLGRWVQSMRTAKKGKGRGLLCTEKIEELENMKFIWDENKYKYEKNVNLCMEFYRANGRKPSEYSKEKYERKIGIFWSRNSSPSNIPKLPQWKIDLLKQIPSFFENKISRFDKFIEMAALFKKENGHLNIKSNDVIDGYKIGQNYFDLVKYYKNEKMTNDQIKTLKDMGIDIDIDKNEKRFKEKMLLARQAVREGVVLNSSNRLYKGVNLYTWKQSHLKDFSDEELKVMNSLISSLKTPIKVEDIRLNKTYVFESIHDAGRALHNEFNIVDSDKKGIGIIHGRLTGKIKCPIYKERFKFEYVDDKVG